MRDRAQEFTLHALPSSGFGEQGMKRQKMTYWMVSVVGVNIPICSLDVSCNPRVEPLAQRMLSTPSLIS